MAKHEAVTEGVIIGFRPDCHNDQVIQFNVSGRTYSNLPSGVGFAPQAPQKVKIYYDSRDPRNFMLTDPAYSAKNNIQEAFWVLLISAAATGFVLMYAAIRRLKPGLPPIFR